MEKVEQLDRQDRGGLPIPMTAPSHSAMNDRAAQLNQRYRRNKGHRQHYTAVKINQIVE